MTSSVPCQSPSPPLNYKIGGTEKIHSLYIKWFAFYYQHKVIINYSYPGRNLMKFFIVFLWAKAKFYVPKHIITSKCSAYQHILFQPKPNIKLHLWPLVANICTFSQNNVWLPIYLCSHKIHILVYKESRLHDSDSTFIAQNYYLHIDLTISLQQAIIRRKSNMLSWQKMAKGC